MCEVKGTRTECLEEHAELGLVGRARGVPPKGALVAVAVADWGEREGVGHSRVEGRHRPMEAAGPTGVGHSHGEGTPLVLPPAYR